MQENFAGKIRCLLIINASKKINFLFLKLKENMKAHFIIHMLYHHPNSGRY